MNTTNVYYKILDLTLNFSGNLSRWRIIAAVGLVLVALVALIVFVAIGVNGGI